MCSRCCRDRTPQQSADAIRIEALSTPARWGTCLLSYRRSPSHYRPLRSCLHASAARATLPRNKRAPSVLKSEDLALRSALHRWPTTGSRWASAGAVAARPRLHEAATRPPEVKIVEAAASSIAAAAASAEAAAVAAASAGGAMRTTRPRRPRQPRCHRRRRRARRVPMMARTGRAAARRKSSTPVSSCLPTTRLTRRDRRAQTSRRRLRGPPPSLHLRLARPRKRSWQHWGPTIATEMRTPTLMRTFQWVRGGARHLVVFIAPMLTCLVPEPVVLPRREEPLQDLVRKRLGLAPKGSEPVALEVRVPSHGTLAASRSKILCAVCAHCPLCTLCRGRDVGGASSALVCTSQNFCPALCTAAHSLTRLSVQPVRHRNYVCDKCKRCTEFTARRRGREVTCGNCGCDVLSHLQVRQRQPNRCASSFSFLLLSTPNALATGRGRGRCRCRRSGLRSRVRRRRLNALVSADAHCVGEVVERGEGGVEKGPGVWRVRCRAKHVD